MSTCQGCGAELAPSKGRPRIWCSEHCRKQQYAGSCVDCGALLNGSDGRGPDAPVRCVSCAAVANGLARTRWTRETVITAIQEWHSLFGHTPSVTEWSPTRSRILGCDRFLSAYLAEPLRWPSYETVCREFGTLSAATKAAGFEPRRRGQLVERVA